MNKDEFEKEFPIPAHWIEWSEEKHRYTCFVDLADTRCAEYNKMFAVWEKRQQEIDALEANNIRRSEHIDRLQKHNVKLQKRLRENGLEWKDLIDGTLTSEGSKLEDLRDCDTSPNCKKYER
ncbi:MULTISPECIES: hypothetical protein [unclassified Acinetobacter]|uniref:hypothetical protein n=1 Tax=unclassified Acinetobacter TaxID=196816 RepID=UPI001F4A607C|nr:MULTISPECIES: hypothetical protein [unclassified Acinetobacter]MCH7353292.1 hypothetical protein [Acinetobacter sp. NIPH 2023]MCH7360674.1 hypothetical protein [Acinetobacter sp. NIPH 2024]